MSESQRDGVGLGIAFVLAIVALMAGLASGLVLGAAGGYLVGQRATGDGQPATVEQAARAHSEPDVAPRRATEPAAGEPGQEALDPARPSEATPGLQGIPGIVLGGADSPYLGVEVATEPITNEAGAALPGAAVLSVVPDTAAQQAGLLPGDRIVAFDDDAVADGADLVAAISRAEVGQEIALTVMRGEEQLSMTATLGARPGVIPLTPGQPNIDELLEQMPPELREQFRRMLRPDTDDSDA